MSVIVDIDYKRRRDVSVEGPKRHIMPHGAFYCQQWPGNKPGDGPGLPCTVASGYTARNGAPPRTSARRMEVFATLKLFFVCFGRAGNFFKEMMRNNELRKRTAFPVCEKPSLRR